MQIVNTLSALLELLSRKHAIGILWLSSVLHLAAPAPLLEALGIAQLTNEYRHIFGFTFLISSACFIVRIAVAVRQYVVQSARDRTTRKRKERLFKTLRKDEHEIIRQFAIAELGELSFHRGNKAVMSLVGKGILLDLGATLSDKLPTRQYRIAPAYSQYVNADLHIMPLSECPQDSQSG